MLVAVGCFASGPRSRPNAGVVVVYDGRMEGGFTDEELTALALATDPDDVVIDDDAEPFGGLDRGAALLPAWYMPAPLGAGSGPRGRKAAVVSVLVLSMFTVNAVGLCVTYGIPEVGDRVTSLFR